MRLYYSPKAITITAPARCCPFWSWNLALHCEVQDEVMNTAGPQALAASTQACAAQTQSNEPRPSISNKPRSRIFLPVLATACLLWACYFPLNLGWLGWLALVPFLVLVRKEAPGVRLYFGSFLAGLFFYLASLQWMRVADYRMYFTWIGLAIACALFFLVALFLVRRLDRRSPLPLVLTFPAVWAALEYTRAHIFSGFPWYFLGHTQHELLPIIQISDITGAYGVTFLVAAVNVLIFESLSLSSTLRGWVGLPDSRLRPVSRSLQSGMVLGLLAVVLGYGYWRLGDESSSQGPTVGLIQGNLEQAIRLAATANEEDAATIMIRHYRDLTDRAVNGHPKPGLLVWPETSYPYDWYEITPDLKADQIALDALPWVGTALQPECLLRLLSLEKLTRLQLVEDWKLASARCQRLAENFADRWNTDLLLGLNGSALQANLKPVRYNTAVFVKADGRVDGRYNKIHRVPFGEYVPLKDVLPWMNHLAPYDFDYSVHAGENFTRFTHAAYRFGVLICYEDTDPCLARQYVRSDTGGPPVDFLLNISNDGWFHGTSEHEEHLAICRFRAVECRRAVARAVNMGISAVIDGNGRITALPAQSWAESKKVAAVLTAPIPIDNRASLYAAWGDWFPSTCWAAIAAGLLWSMFRGKLNSQAMLPERVC
jgi:apolipoprotein N-acyltransferase